MKPIEGCTQTPFESAPVNVVVVYVRVASNVGKVVLPQAPPAPKSVPGPDCHIFHVETADKFTRT